MSELPADQAERDLFRLALDRNFAVAASAGSGKTTAISERLAAIALDAKHAPLLKNTAVVTYTKKAAAQIGQRARNVLLRRLAEDGVKGLGALDSLERAFFGTIHSFCLLLAQRYGQSLGINLNPTAVEGDEDERLWEEFLESDPMQFASLAPAQIDAFFRHVSIESVFTLARDLDISAAERLLKLQPKATPAGPSEAVLQEILTTVPKRKSEAFARNQADARAWFERFHGATGHLAIIKPDGSAAGVKELYARFFRPLKSWLAEAGSVLAAELALRYRDWRFERGIQTFKDQIDAAVSVLRNPETLERIRADGWRVILDEAQDTDPDQFAVLVEITRPAGSQLGAWPGAGEGPRPGHFCMVGDMQQAIYGSRADIRNFAKHMRAFEQGQGGEKLTFSVTFRTPVKVADFLNRTLPEGFGPLRAHNLGMPPAPGAPAPHLQVAYEPLISGPKNEDGAVGLIAFDVGDATKVGDQTAREAAAIAAFLKQTGFAALGAASWGDVCILAPRNDWLAVARRQLEAAGLKVSVQMRKNRSGDSPAYAWACGLVAVLCEPDDTFEWVGVLREIFGVSDTVIAGELRREKSIHWEEPKVHGEALGEALTVLQPFIQRVDDEGDRLEVFAGELFTACALAARAQLIDPSGQLQAELDGLLAQAAELGLEGLGVRGWRLALLEGLEGTRPSGRASSDAITLATSHSAKGLEWPVVIPLGLWRPILNRAATGFMLVPDGSGERRVYFDGESMPQDTKDARERERLRELVRLLYVTLTRARRVLLLPREQAKAAPKGESFAGLWNGLLEEGLEHGATLAGGPAEEAAGPQSEPPASPELPVSGPVALPLARRLLPHQLSEKPDLIRSATHESQLDEPVSARPTEDPIEYGLWWHETMEFLPWTGDDAAVAAFVEARLARAQERGFEARGRAEWERFRASGVWPALREARWTRVAELSVFAPLEPDAWIDGVIDLVLQDPVSNEVWIVDWKTNRVREGEGAKAALGRLAHEYQRQLAAYGTCAAGIFQGATVKVFLFATGIGDWIEVKWV